MCESTSTEVLVYLCTCGLRNASNMFTTLIALMHGDDIIQVRRVDLGGMHNENTCSQSIVGFGCVQIRAYSVAFWTRHVPTATNVFLCAP